MMMPLSSTLTLLFIAGMFSPLAAQDASAPANTGTVIIDTDSAVVKDYWGAGVQWDPSDQFDYTQEQWNYIDQRVAFIQPGFIRCCITGAAYSTGFNASGNPIYQWDSPLMKRLYHILDFCQAHHVRVILGDWWPTFGLTWDDPRWDRLLGDLFNHLVKTKGYTCIAAVNKYNEPSGTYDDFLAWKKGQLSIKATLEKKGLADQVVVAAPDSWEPWIGWTAGHLGGTVGLYESHLYPKDSIIESGKAESIARGFREEVNALDPNGLNVPYLLGEAGTGDWPGKGVDSNTHIRDFIYGVYMADYFVQSGHGGLHGMSAWMLDDSMHNQDHTLQIKGVTTGDPKVDDNLKEWGMWNTMGTSMGKPDEEKPRPWYTAWALASHCFPRGATVLSTGPAPFDGTRVGASMVRHGNQADLGIIVVNDSDSARVVHLTVPKATGTATLQQYDYFDQDRPVDADGIPTIKQTLKDVDLNAGIDLNLPTRGAIFLTTTSGGSPVTLK